jgi:hypothetical protein
MQADLLPDEFCQTRGTSTLTAEATQANEHNEKQGDVGNGHSDDGGQITIGVYRVTKASGSPYDAELRIR